MRALRNIWFLALATCTEGIRHKALWAIVGLAALLTTANVGVTTLYAWDIGKVSVEFGLSAVAFAGLLLVFFLGLKILADDLERSRIFMLLSRPVSIWEYLTGKFLGLVLILLLTTIILGLSAALSMRFVLWQYPAYVPPNFSWIIYAMALTCQWVSLVVVMAVSVLCFSFASHPFIALLLSVSAYLVGQNMELLRRVVVENPQAGMLTGQENLVVVLSWIFPNLSLFDKKYEAAYGMAFNGQEFVLLCLYGFTYSALLIFFATLFYKRKELA
jgi:ABC-type transport system involved in multi-copper enzyme maturation permease subunit